MCSLLGFSGRFYSYWQPNFPAVSVVTCRDFPAVSAVTGSRIFRPYLQLLAGIFCRYLFRQGNVKSVPLETRRPGFSGHICCFWPGFSGRSFSGTGNFKKTLWAADKLFQYQQLDFLSLIREFSGGKLKQKGFFHSVWIHLDPSLNGGGVGGGGLTMFTNRPVSNQFCSRGGGGLWVFLTEVVMRQIVRLVGTVEAEGVRT